jgi:Domain of unknown function (DUF3644)
VEILSMPKEPKYKSLLNNSIDAAVSAIEIYNKPDFKYREETFCILLSNAWELLLKAKLLKENTDNSECLFVKEKNTKRSESKEKTEEHKINRCGNKVTIGIFETINQLNSKKLLLEAVCISNIEILIEIRDSAIHFFNKDPLLCKRVLEVGTASLRSFIKLIQDWFDLDMSKYNFYIMPITFFHEFEFSSSSISKQDKQTERLLNFISDKEKEHPFDEKSEHSISLQLETKFIKSKSPEAMPVKWTNDKKAPAVTIKEEDLFKDKYNIPYRDLLKKCKERYSDFKADKIFNAIKAKLTAPSNNERYGKTRYLDPIRKKGANKTLYSPEIFKELDKKYKKK